MFAASNSSTGSSMFGNTQAAKPAGFSFGSTPASNTTANGASGSAFPFANNSAAKPASAGFGSTASGFGNTASGFGNNNNTSGFGNNTSGFGNNTSGFGNTTSGFGNTAAGNTSSGNTASSGLFGANTTNTTNNSSLFGNNTNQNTSTNGSLFGKSNATTSFGNTSTSGGLFGQSNNTAQPASGGSFGATNANSAQAAPGGLFGSANSNTQPSTGGLFGSTAPKPATGGLFGSNNSTQPAQSTGGLFGGSTSQPNQPATGGLFGSSTAQNNSSGGLFSKPAAPSGGLFGSNNTQATQQSGGLFGNSANSGGSGLFGNTQNQKQTQTNGNAPNQGSGTQFNSAQPSFGWSNSQQNAAPNGTTSLHDKITASVQSAQNTTKYTPTINDQLAKLKDQWNPNSPKCALTSHVYNKFSEQDINYLLQQPRPQNESPEEWEKAMAARPSPLHYPVKITSFTEVAQRVETQLEQVAKSRVLLNNIHEKSIQLSSQRDLDTTTRMMKAKVRHNKLSKRLLNVATTLAVLKLKGYPLLPEEEEMSKQFQSLNAKLSDPSGPGGSLSDLFARLAILKERSEDLSSHLETSINKMNGGLSNIASDDSHGSQEVTNQTEQIIQSLTKILYKQQVGLSYLNDVVQQDLAIIEKEG